MWENKWREGHFGGAVKWLMERTQLLAGRAGGVGLNFCIQGLKICDNVSEERMELGSTWNHT
jgi:hypothetical protein